MAGRALNGRSSCEHTFYQYHQSQFIIENDVLVSNNFFASKTRGASREKFGLEIHWSFPLWKYMGSCRVLFRRQNSVCQLSTMFASYSTKTNQQQCRKWPVLNLIATASKGFSFAHLAKMGLRGDIQKHFQYRCCSVALWFLPKRHLENYGTFSLNVKVFGIAANSSTYASLLLIPKFGDTCA
jgi:hypothetical protein